MWIIGFNVLECQPVIADGGSCSSMMPLQLPIPTQHADRLAGVAHHCPGLIDSPSDVGDDSQQKLSAPGRDVVADVPKERAERGSEQVVRPPFELALHHPSEEGEPIPGGQPLSRLIRVANIIVPCVSGIGHAEQHRHAEQPRLNGHHWNAEQQNLQQIGAFKATDNPFTKLTFKRIIIS